MVDAILTSGRVEQQTYRSCMGLLKLAEKYSPVKLEEACNKALLYSRTPSYKSIKNLLAAMKEDPPIRIPESEIPFIRDWGTDTWHYPGCQILRR